MGMRSEVAMVVAVATRTRDELIRVDHRRRMAVNGCEWL